MYDGPCINNFHALQLHEIKRENTTPTRRLGYTQSIRDERFLQRIHHTYCVHFTSGTFVRSLFLSG